jgi:hypothetical protein
MGNEPPVLEHPAVSFELPLRDLRRVLSQEGRERDDHGLERQHTMALLSLLCSLIVAGAGCSAIAAIAITIQAQLPAVRKLMAESRMIAADRDFLVRITAQTAPARPPAVVRPRRMPARVIKFVRAAEKPLCAAA